MYTKSTVRDSFIEVKTTRRKYKMRISIFWIWEWVDSLISRRDIIFSNKKGIS